MNLNIREAYTTKAETSMITVRMNICEAQYQEAEISGSITYILYIQRVRRVRLSFLTLRATFVKSYPQYHYEVQIGRAHV